MVKHSPFSLCCFPLHNCKRGSRAVSEGPRGHAGTAGLCHRYSRQSQIKAFIFMAGYCYLMTWALRQIGYPGWDEGAGARGNKMYSRGRTRPKRGLRSTSWEVLEVSAAGDAGAGWQITQNANWLHLLPSPCTRSAGTPMGQTELCPRHTQRIWRPHVPQGGKWLQSIWVHFRLVHRVYTANPTGHKLTAFPWLRITLRM